MNTSDIRFEEMNAADYCDALSQEYLNRLLASTRAMRREQDAATPEPLEKRKFGMEENAAVA